MKNVKNERSLYWCLVLYPEEDLSHKKAIEYIENHYSYASIIHDNDLNEDGTLKKSHVHIVLRFSNYRWRNAISQELNITPNYLEKCKNLENALKYLVHINNPDKFQYEISQVHGDLKNKLLSYLKDKSLSESEQAKQLLLFIQDYPTSLSLSDFLIFCCDHGFYSIYRRNAYTFNKILEEHNFEILRKNQYKY